MSDDVSLFRLYLMRLLYFLNFAMLGRDVWPSLISHSGPWDPVKGVAFSFWGALSLLSILGLRYPLRMVPLLLMQFTYKCIWLAAVALPQWSTIRSSGLSKAMIGGLIADLVVIPWPYVFRSFVKGTGDRWRSIRPKTAPSASEVL
jgi:hypothetical protein